MNAVHRVAVATSKVAGDDDLDLPVLVDAIHASGMRAKALEWDADHDWAAFDVVLVRSTWDYAWRLQEFSSWVSRVSNSTLLVNPPEVIRWNLNKRYLRDVENAGLPVVPTAYFRAGEPMNLPEGEIVVKPVVSAGARNTARYLPEARTEAIEHIRMLHGEGVDAMVQPYLKEIDTMGERALVFFNGSFSHAMRKGAVLNTRGIDNNRIPHPDLCRYTPSPAELATAAATLRAVPGSRHPLLYARVDLVPGCTGEPVLMEIELVEPNLFLIDSEGAATRFAAALVRLLQKVSDGT